jgi:DNA replication protein DnaC
MVVVHGVVRAVCPAVLILDDFSMRELTAAQADDLYELITERVGRSVILTSNRAPADWYPLFPNPVVAESLLDRLINTSHQVVMNGAQLPAQQETGTRHPHRKGGHQVKQALARTRGIT